MAIVFGAVVTVLLQWTPLPISWWLARYLGKDALEIAGVVYAIGALIVLARVLRHGPRVGWSRLREPRHAVPILLPYFSLDFIILTLRRSICSHQEDVRLHADVEPAIEVPERLIVVRGVQPQDHVLQVQEEEDGDEHRERKYFDYKIVVSLLFLCEVGGRRLSERYFLAYTLLLAVGGLAYLAMPATDRASRSCSKSSRSRRTLARGDSIT